MANVTQEQKPKQQHQESQQLQGEQEQDTNQNCHHDGGGDNLNNANYDSQTDVESESGYDADDEVGNWISSESIEEVFGPNAIAATVTSPSNIHRFCDQISSMVIDLITNCNQQQKLTESVRYQCIRHALTRILKIGRKSLKSSSIGQSSPTPSAISTSRSTAPLVVDLIITGFEELLYGRFNHHNSKGNVDENNSDGGGDDAENENNGSWLQIQAIHLFAECIRHDIKSKYLKGWISLFKINSAPRPLLIRSTQRLLRLHELLAHQVSSVLFPADPVLYSALKSDASLATTYAFHLRKDLPVTETLRRLGVREAAICLPLPSNDNPIIISSASRQYSFSLSFWLKFESEIDISVLQSTSWSSSRKVHRTSSANAFDGHLHLISILYSKSLSLEFWFEVSSRLKFNVKLVQLDASVPTLLSSAEVTVNERILRDWHLIGINVQDIYLKGSAKSFKINLILDGQHQYDSFLLQVPEPSTPRGASFLHLSESSIFKRPSTDSISLLFGSVSSSMNISYQLTTLMLYRDALKLDDYLYMFCMGPFFHQYIKCQLHYECDSARTIPFSHLNTNLMAWKLHREHCPPFEAESTHHLCPDEMHLHTDQLLLDVDERLNSKVFDSICENLAMVYAPYHNSDEYLWYSLQTHAPNPSSWTQFTSWGLLSGSLKTLSEQKYMEYEVSSMKVLKFADIHVKDRSQFCKAICECGGIASLMILAVKIIEEEDENQDDDDSGQPAKENEPTVSHRVQESHSVAIDILLSAIHLHDQIFMEFMHNLNGFDLLIYLLKNAKTIVSQRMLLTFLRYSVSDEHNLGTSFIISRLMFGYLLKSWSVWKKDPMVFESLVEGLDSLTCDENLHSGYNIMQMRSSMALESILNFFLECFSFSLEQNKFIPSEKSIIILSQVIMRLIGINPPNPNHTAKVVNCLLLLHKPTNAYVSHSRNSFFYLFNWVGKLKKSNHISKGITRRATDSEAESSSTNVPSSPDLLKIKTEEWDIISNVSDGTTEASGAASVDNNLNLLINELLSSLIYIVEASPSHSLTNLLGSSLKLEDLTLLMNNSSSMVRESVLKLLLVCFKRSPVKDQLFTSFQKIKGFHLMANQLHRYSATYNLVNLSYALICDADPREFDFRTSIHLMQFPSKLNSIQLHSFLFLFALLPNSLPDTLLTEWTLQTLSHIISKLSTLAIKSLIDLGLFECLIHVILKDDSIEDGLLVEVSQRSSNPLQTIVGLVGLLFSQSGGQINFQIYMDSVNLFSAVCSRVTGQRLNCIRSLMFYLLEAGLNSSKMFFGETDDEALLDTSSTSDSRFSGTSLELSDAYERSVGRKKNRPSFVEMIGRINELVSKATDIIINKPPECEPGQKEKDCIRRFLCWELEFYQKINHDLLQSGWRKQNLKSSLRTLQGTLRSSIMRLILFCLSPLMDGEQRIAYSLLFCAMEEIIQLVVDGSPGFYMMMVAFLTDIRTLTQFPDSEFDNMDALITFAEQFTKEPNGRHVGGDLSRPDYKTEIKEWFEDLNKKRLLYFKSKATTDKKMLTKFDSTADAVAENCMSITRSVNETQSSERKAVLQRMKEASAQDYKVKTQWKDLIERMTHERALWYLPQYYPSSWELDPTEGPSRIRKRLRRCFLDIPPRFFINKGTVKSEPQRSLFSFLFETDLETTTALNLGPRESGTLIDRIYAKERIYFTRPCLMITPAKEYKGEILIGDSSVHFVADIDKAIAFKEVWPFDEICELQRRRYQLRNNALEIFLTNGMTNLISFETTTAREDFLGELSQRPLPNYSEGDCLVLLTQMWRENKITNFEYLTQLNKFGGRSFNDLMQYPVFPFVLSDYESEKLDLTKQESFRNFGRPMAIQRKEREQYFIDQYKYLKNEYDRSKGMGHPMLPTSGPYHYGSHYSNSGTVLHFLVRLPPYTQMFLVYQDNNFDIPDRTFHSMGTSWRLASGDSTTDFKELVPEFYFLPEILLNLERFDFGCRQSGELVDDVILPSWCRNDARLFVLIHRQALEASQVSENLNRWIDLIFGYQQTGKAAVDAINVFHPATYYGTDASKCEDELKRMALETMIRTFGQMPKQLFSVPHPTVISSRYLQVYGSARNVVPLPMKEVIGLRWGDYLGSPTVPMPTLLLKRNVGAAGCLVSLTNDIVFVPSNATILLSFSQQKGGSLMNSSYIMSIALISWVAPDQCIRIKFYLPHRYDHGTPFLSLNSSLDKVTTCASAPDVNTLFVGFASGSVAALILTLPFTVDTKLVKPPVWMIGHSGPIRSIAICKAFSIVVTGSDDGTCIIWDLNRLCYIRTLEHHTGHHTRSSSILTNHPSDHPLHAPSPVTVIAVSETLGDIVSVTDLPYHSALHHPGYHRSTADRGSCLTAHTINGSLIGKIKTEVKVHSVCYSNAPEGISINVIAAGLANGVVKMWSSWDLIPVREIKLNRYERPIVSLCYSKNSQFLCASNDEGVVVIWGRAGHRTQVPQVIRL